MRTILNHGETILVWSLFFASTVYGQIALKVAVGHGEQLSYVRAGQALTSFWGLSAVLAWALSTMLWGVVMTKTTLQTANTVSALRYGLVSIAAWFFLKEAIRPDHLTGMVLITVGIWFCVR